jgi:hypothetical protein
MVRSMYISSNLTLNNNGGSMVGISNYHMFSEINGQNILAISINRNSMQGVTPVKTTASRLGTALANLFGFCSTLSRSGALEIFKEVQNYQPSIIWIDSSLFGRLK